jgi:hypothetical protein
MDIVAHMDTLYPNKSIVKIKNFQNAKARLSPSPLSTSRIKDSSMLAFNTALKKSNGARRTIMSTKSFCIPRSLIIF